MTELVRDEVRSYKQLPLMLYQIQDKFRDERRPRFGLMRSREFIMKDLYSFDKDIEGMNASYQKMYDAYNQSATVNYRWRKDGDVTPMPRAMYQSGYNFQNSDRYVEDGGFVRFQNLQIGYRFDNKMIKKWGLNQLQAYASLNNLYVWTRYSGTDPEVSQRGYNPAIDSSKTPRSKQFTFTLNFGF